MSADPNDIIINAIRRKYSSSICDTLRDQSPLELNWYYKDTLTIPLIAEAKVLWEKFSSVYQLSVEVRTYCKEKSLGARQVFSAESVKSVEESYALADYVIRGLREELAKMILETSEQLKKTA